MGGTLGGLSDQVAEKLPEWDLRVDPQITRQRSGDRVDLVHEQVRAVREEIEPGDTSKGDERSHLLRHVADALGKLGGDLGRELTRRARHPLAPDVLVGVAEDLRLPRGATGTGGPQRPLQCRELERRPAPQTYLKVEVGLEVGLDHGTGAEVGIHL